MSVFNSIQHKAAIRECKVKQMSGRVSNVTTEYHYVTPDTGVRDLRTDQSCLATMDLVP